MLKYDRIDMPERSDVNKTKKLCRGIICQRHVMVVIALLQKSLNFKDDAIVFVKGNCYIISFWYLSKDEAKHLFEKKMLIEGKIVKHYKIYYFII